MKEEPIMLLKIHIEKMSPRHEPIMLMITKMLSHGTHYVSQKKGSYLKSPGENGERVPNLLLDTEGGDGSQAP